MCSGKFSRVLLCRHETRGHYHALKLMVLEDIIRHKQVTSITVMTIVISASNEGYPKVRNHGAGEGPY